VTKMNMITKLATKMLAVLSVVALIASPAAAQGLSASDMAFAFGGKSPVQQTARAAEPITIASVTIASARGMTQAEMQETEGAWWPVVYGAAVLGTRAVMWVAPRLAPSTFRTISNPLTAHTLMINTRTSTHVCQVACGTGTGISGAHVGWGAGGRNGMGAAIHIYNNSPWRFNPW
jgi:hypothetical protein